MSFSRKQTQRKLPTEFLEKGQGSQAFNEGNFTPKFSSSSSVDDVKPFEHEDTYNNRQETEHTSSHNPLFKQKTKTGGRRSSKRSSKRRKTHKKKRNSRSRR